MILLYIFYACYYRVFYFIEYELDDYGGVLHRFIFHQILIVFSSNFNLYMVYCAYIVSDTYDALQRTAVK